MSVVTTLEPLKELESVGVKGVGILPLLLWMDRF